MKIEVLYVADCPSHPPAVSLVKEALMAEGIEAEVTEVLVVDAQMARATKFRGSPTIRINGQDIGGESSHAGTLACRIYPGSQQIGIPPIEMVRSALTRARAEEGRREGKERPGTGISASLLAILGSVATIGCCLPIGFAAAVGAGAASAFFATLRPWLLGLSVVLIAVGFWQQHRARQCAVSGRWIGNLLLWAAVVVVIGMTLFPQLVAGFIADRFYGK